MKNRIKALRTKIGIAAGATVLAGVGIGAMATPAQAAFSDCSAGALCAYLSTSGGGSPGQVFGDNSNLRQYDKFARAKSLKNNGNQCNVRLWVGTGFTGDNHRLTRGNVISNTQTWNNGMFRNGVGANKWC
ncbi:MULTISPECIES: peptidase inhibitor family I36 protein [Streptomyces]|uniref:peptidase inhibitor family I36 protein n=1 Tax=Streptomyces TaxID=1883 RepID=UPI001F2237CA|nr:MULTISPECIES: peptidase inhibitor family I36 protein [unclassified Streptomyces]MCU4746970.1 peptidase inhibitor family I36 protein [Streptomyces sp. G-5]